MLESLQAWTLSANVLEQPAEHCQAAQGDAPILTMDSGMLLCTGRSNSSSSSCSSSCCYQVAVVVVVAADSRSLVVVVVRSLVVIVLVISK